MAQTAVQQTTQSLQPKPKRIWEIDALRGLLILFVVFDHMMFDFWAFSNSFNTALMQNISNFAYSYWHSGIRTATHYYFVGGFVVLSGLSTWFSQNNMMKALRVLFFALLLTWITYLGEATNFWGGNIMTFGILHMLGVSGLLFAFLQKCKLPLWAIGIIGLVMIVVGHYFRAVPLQMMGDTTGLKRLIALVVHSMQGDTSVGSMLSPGDFFSLLPWCGWFFAGAAIAPHLYKNKTTLLPKVNERYFKPLMFCGRHSLSFYLLGQVVVLAVLFFFIWIV